VMRHYGQHEDKVLVQELGVNPDLFTGMDRKQARKELGLPDDAPLLLFAGSFHPHHDLHSLIRAFSSVRHEIPGIRLVLVGDGALRKSAEKWVLEEGAGDVVLFAGARPYEEMPSWFAACNLFVIPLLKRRIRLQNGSLVTKLWEAMASGIPVVITDLPDMPSAKLLEDKAWIVLPEDVPAMTDAIVTVMNNKRGQIDRVEKARSYALTHRTWRQAACETVDFIERRLRAHD